MATIHIRQTSRQVLLIATAAILAVAHWYIGKWGLANMVSTHAEEPQIADLAVDWGPSDPQTHFAAAVLYDRTFLPADQQRSLLEYENAVSLSPHNYLLWLEYGKALERSGDPSRAELALKRALELAPNYASVQWALGNLLVRNGDIAAGFEQMRRAVDGDPQYAASAAFFAYQYFNGNVDEARKVCGTSSHANAALALLLAKQKRFDEAASVWQSVSQPFDDSIKTSGKSLVSELIAVKRFAMALKVSKNLDDSLNFVSESIDDGGFEEAIKLEGASPFEWQIGQGDQPQVLQSTSQPHGGSRSLVLRFSSNDGSNLRSISQTAVVRPGVKYVISGFYHSDLKADGKLVWQVLDASSDALLTETALADAGSWLQFSTVFQSPIDTDAIIVRITVKGCGSALCPISGSVWLDDIDLKAL